MGRSLSRMDDTAIQLPWDYMGLNKQDRGKGCVQLVLRIDNLYKNRDTIVVQYPKEGSELLRIFINDKDISYKVPCPVIEKECSHEVDFGKKGKIILTLKMSEAKEWTSRWSPTRVFESSLQPALDEADHVPILAIENSEP